MGGVEQPLTSARARLTASFTSGPDDPAGVPARKWGMDLVYASRPSRAWAVGFRALYALLWLLDPLLRMLWLQSGLGNVIEVTIPGRKSGRPRRTLLGLLSTGGEWYLGHPNGPSQWTRNLDAAGGRLQLAWPGQPPVSFRAEPVPPGKERDEVILATNQHPFPGDLIYRLGRRHVLQVGRYYRLELDAGE